MKTALQLLNFFALSAVPKSMQPFNKNRICPVYSSADSRNSDYCRAISNARTLSRIWVTLEKTHEREHLSANQIQNSKLYEMFKLKKEKVEVDHCCCRARGRRCCGSQFTTIRGRPCSCLLVRSRQPELAWVKAITISSISNSSSIIIIITTIFIVVIFIIVSIFIIVVITIIVTVLLIVVIIYRLSSRTTR